MLVILKPDAVSEAKVGRLISEIELAGFEILHADMRVLAPETIFNLYAEHTTRVYWPLLYGSMRAGPCFIMHVAGDLDRLLALKAAVRHGRTNPFNLIHTSDSVGAAERELRIFGWSFAHSSGRRTTVPESHVRDVEQDLAVEGRVDVVVSRNGQVVDSVQGVD